MWLGWVPGLRILATQDLRAGLPLVVAGLGTLVAFLVVAFSWPARASSFAALRFLPGISLIDVGALVLLAATYEGLRIAGEVGLRRDAWAPRCIAALFLPSLVASLFLPYVVRFAPRAMEATWWAATTLALGSSLGVVACVGERLGARYRRLPSIWGGILGAVLLAGSGVALVLPAAAAPWISSARDAGFYVLPTLFSP